jgi:LysM repeat protein
VRGEMNNRRQWLPWIVLAAIVLLILVIGVIYVVTRRATEGEETPTPTTAQLVPLQVEPGVTAVGSDPVAQQIQVGDKAVVAVRAENIANVYGIELHIQFDPTGLEVEDADPKQTGIQLQSSDFFKPDFVVQNRADNDLGTIDYAVTLIAPKEPVEGSGVLVTINFVGKQEGNYTVLFNEVKLASPDGQRIPAETMDGQIAVGTSVQGLAITGTPVAVVPTATPTATPVAPTNTPIVMPTSVPPTPTPTSTPAPTTPGSCACTYIVRTGDTLWSIARRFGSPMQSIAQANGIINFNYIQVGQVLCLPGGIPPPTPAPAIYIVRPGDTLCSIARRFGTTAWAIALANNLQNPNLIYIGQQLIIPV